MRTDEGRLLVRVVLRAAIDWLQYRNHVIPEKRRLAARAYAWLFKESLSKLPDDLDKFMAFESVCESLGLNPVEVRSWVCRHLDVDTARRLYYAD